MRDFNKEKVKFIEKNGRIYIPEGTKIIVYYGMQFELGHDKLPTGRPYKVSASQIANCYGLSCYPNLILINDDEEKELRGLDLSECLEIGIRHNYPIIDFYKPSKTIDVPKMIRNT